MNKTAYFSMKALCQATGKSRRTIIYFEDKGELPTPKRDSNNHRLYTAEDIQFYIEFFKNRKGK